MHRHLWETIREKKRRAAIRQALAENRQKMPKEFVGEYLSSRGWRWVDSATCYTCFKDADVKHVIKFLWSHISQGHEVQFTSCHTWQRQIGRDTGEFEYWYAWYIHAWDKEHNCFQRELDEMGIT